LNGFVAHLETTLDRAAAASPRPGRTALHRLNRAEYANAIRDLLALEIDATALLPADDESSGFDNIADVLTVSPSLMERYLSASWNISRMALGNVNITPSTATYRVRPDLSQDQHIDVPSDAVLVAEGSAIVMSLIQTGKIEAIVGVSCLSVLERAFPYMEAAAIPGVAVPLLQDDCIDTTVDLDWVWDYIHLSSDDTTRRLDLGALREEVDFWFTPASLPLIMGAANGETECIARDWLMRAGKRWRPFLAVSVYQALRENPTAALPEDVRKIAVAVECFHKASLIHDDIEDNDSQRYGEKTLHEEHGVAVALNVGDLLIG
jgi:hypothetical protein